METFCLVEVFYVDWGEVFYEVEIGHDQSGIYSSRINAYEESSSWTLDTSPIEGVEIPYYVRRKAAIAVDRWNAPLPQPSSPGSPESGDASEEAER